LAVGVTGGEKAFSGSFKVKKGRIKKNAKTKTSHVIQPANVAGG